MWKDQESDRYRCKNNPQYRVTELCFFELGVKYLPILSTTCIDSKVESNWAEDAGKSWLFMYCMRDFFDKKFIIAL